MNELVELLLSLTLEDGIEVKFMNSVSFHGIMEIELRKKIMGDTFKIVRGVDPYYELNRMKLPAEKILITKLKEMREDLLKMEGNKRVMAT